VKLRSSWQSRSRSANRRSIDFHAVVAPIVAVFRKAGVTGAEVDDFIQPSLSVFTK
jgi:hypothetical protein